VTSIETETLRSAGKTISDDAHTFASETVGKLAALTMPHEAFPLFAWGLVNDYEQVRRGVADVTGAVQAAIDAIGAALTNIANHYEEQERVRSDNFSYRD